MTTTDTGIPAEAIEHLRAVQAERDAAQNERFVAAGEQVAARFAAEQRKIVTPEAQERLRRRGSELRLPENAGLDAKNRRAAAMRAYATELGVDLVALDRMRADFAEQARALNELERTGGVELTWRGQGEDTERTSDKRNYDGWWDPGYSWSSSRPGDFAIWNADSYFDPVTNRTGSHIRYRQRETGDKTTCSMSWRNGYMVLYTPSVTGGVVVDIDLACQISRFFIDTDNEPGSSACDVSLTQSVQIEFYHSWADAVPVETRIEHIAVTGTSNPENWQDYVAVPAWKLLHARIPSFKTYQAGHQLAIFVSTRNQATGIKLDDTRLTAGVNAAYYVDDIVVSRLV
ncbi:hypothetical protein ACSNOI_41585 [Actinomadura kijaniata]|uniref:hypothetical protein n=1 Tax=Actinomadura kijaniata TaxID=46161 RepID=UPI003F1955B8